MEEVFLKDDIHIADLKDRQFIIPSYQRGYKWRERDVRYLLFDLLEYEGDKPYYMQPLVVAEKDGKHIVVDGQQRLTTFYLVWRRLASKGYFSEHPFSASTCYSLEYENRPKSTKYLSPVSFDSAADTPDTRNFEKAEAAVDEALRDITEGQIKHLEENFFKKATFLWYKLEDPEEGPKTFERLNGKRIALTDIELCKVFLLSNTCTSAAQRNERASAWQNMEYRLQDDSFYSFISKDYTTSHDQSRMGYVLDIALSAIKAEKNEYLDYPLYNRLKADTMSGKNVWRAICQTFHRIEQMYDNPPYYNLVGFLTNGTPTKLKDIMAETASPDFGKWVVKRISEWVNAGTEIEKLTYKDGKTYSALLLFNILCDLIVKDSKHDKIEDRYGFSHRFRFDLLHSEGYDKEHVHATNSHKLQSAIEWQQWSIKILTHLPESLLKQINETDLEIMKKVKGIKVVRSKDEDEKTVRKRLADEITKVMNSQTFSRIFDEVSSITKEDDGDDNQNSIGNMALLNLSINRDPAYAASPFAVKRAIIRQRVKGGKFVPRGTQLMFDKSFRESPDEMYHWAKSDYANGAESDKESFIKFFAETINRLEA